MSTTTRCLRSEPQQSLTLATRQALEHSATNADTPQVHYPQKRVPIDYMLNDSDELDSAEYEEMYTLFDCIKLGSLPALEMAVRSYANNARRLAKLANALKQVIGCPQLSIPYTPIARMADDHDKVHDVAVFTIRLQHSHDYRTLSIGTDPKYKTKVCGPPRDGKSVLPMEVSEDPRLLLMQIGRLVCLPSSPTPPPLSASYR